MKDSRGRRVGLRPFGSDWLWCVKVGGRGFRPGECLNKGGGGLKGICRGTRGRPDGWWAASSHKRPSPAAGPRQRGHRAHVWPPSTD